MKKTFKILISFLIVSVILTSMAITAFAAEENTDTIPDVAAIQVDEINAEDATSAVGDTSVVTVRLGKNYANQYFTLETDAGVDSRPYQADSEGNVEFYFEVGSSSHYELTLLDTGRELEPLTEVIATQSQSVEDDTTKAETDTIEEKGEKAVNPKSVIIFIVGMIIAVSYLVLSKMMPKIKAKKANGDIQGNNAAAEEIKTPFDDDEL